MNLWKPIALVAVAGLAASLSIQFASTASALPEPHPLPPAQLHPCVNQPHMAGARAGVKAAIDALAGREDDHGNWGTAAVNQLQSVDQSIVNGCLYADEHHH